MSDKSGIEWTESTWNPVTGCSKVSHGCKHCYAEREWPRLAAPRAKPNIYTGRAFTDVVCHPEKLDIPLRWTKPRRIFVNSMSDLFHESVPDEFIEAVFVVMQMANQHTFQVLTKRPERMLHFLTNMDSRLHELGYPQGVAGRYPNVWFGVSIEDQATADERIPSLLDSPAAVRFLSCEPLIGPIDLSAGLLWLKQFPIEPNIHWVIVGGESGPKARPMHPDWVRSLRDQCQATSVPFFFKQWGEWIPGEGDGRAPAKWQNGETGKHSCAEKESATYHKWGPFGEPGAFALRIGKKAAGRDLDRRTWDEYPIH